VLRSAHSGSADAVKPPLASPCGYAFRMAEVTHTDRYEPPRIEARDEISPVLIGGLTLTSTQTVPG
jgi:hypothetical protein